jgi:hypothetical protein
MNDTVDTAADNDLVRQQSFDCDGPVELDIELGPGLVEVRLAEDAESVVHVEVRHAPSSGGPLGAGLRSLLSWVDQFGGGGDDLPAQAVRDTTIAKHGDRVVVHAPKAMPMRRVPLGIVVLAPPGSAVAVRAGSADVRVSGTAGRSSIEAGSGDVSLDRADGSVHVRTGSGSARLGTIGGSLSARSGSGDLEISVLNDNASISTGSGDVWIGTVQGGDLTGKTGSGDLTIADVARGQLELTTGSGDLRVGIRAGVTAELDLSTGSGRARSELPVSEGATPTDAETVVRVRGRTGSGDAIVTRATA